MLLKSTKINLVISVSVLLLSIIVLSGTSYFILNDIERLNQNLALINESDSLSQSYSRLAEVIEDSASEREELESFVLHEDNIITFLSDIELKGRSLGLDLNTKSLDTNEGEGAFDTLEISFEFTGSYNSIFNFLETLETLPFHSRLEMVSMVKDKDLTTQIFTGNILLIVTLETYE